VPLEAAMAEGLLWARPDLDMPRTAASAITLSSNPLGAIPNFSRFIIPLPGS
jgi:hypothetical protein